MNARVVICGIVWLSALFWSAPPALTQTPATSNWRVFYTQFKACASRAAIDYDRLKTGDFFVYVEALHQACNTEKMLLLVPLLPQDNAQEVAETSGSISICATLGALRNLQMLAPELESQFGDDCRPALRSVGILDW